LCLLCIYICVCNRISLKETTAITPLPWSTPCIVPYYISERLKFEDMDHFKQSHVTLPNWLLTELAWIVLFNKRLLAYHPWLEYNVRLINIVFCVTSLISYTLLIIARVNYSRHICLVNAVHCFCYCIKNISLRMWVCTKDVRFHRLAFVPTAIWTCTTKHEQSSRDVAVGLDLQQSLVLSNGFYAHNEHNKNRRESKLKTNFPPYINIFKMAQTIGKIKRLFTT
jgi:hypothetical protein